MEWFGRNLEDHPTGKDTFHYRRLFQPGLEHFHGWGSQAFLGNLGPQQDTRTQRGLCWLSSHLEVHTGRPGVRSSPWSSAGRAPCLRASVLPRIAGGIRLIRAGGSCTGASGGSSACTLHTRNEQTVSVKRPELPLHTRVPSNIPQHRQNPSSNSLDTF